MSYVDTLGLYYPYPERGFPGGISRVTYASLTLTTQYAAMVFRAPKTGNLEKIGFAVINAPTPQNLTVSFQDVDATGFPDGTNDQFRAVASGSLGANTFVVTDAITSDGTNGGTRRAVNQGDWVAFVIKLDVNGDVNFGGLASNHDQMNYPIDNGSKQSRGLMILVVYDDGSYGYVNSVNIPSADVTTDNFNSGSTPDERGLKFQFPFKCKVTGAVVKSDGSGAFDVVLYDSDGTTVLTQITNAVGQRFANNATTFWVPFEDEVELLADTYYRLVIKPTSVTNVGVSYFDVANAAYLDSIDSLGQLAHYTSRTDAGAWTDTTTRRPYLALHISQIDVVGAGFGVSSFPFIG